MLREGRWSVKFACWREFSSTSYDSRNCSTRGSVARLEGSDTRIPMTPLDNPAHFAGVRHQQWDGEITQSFLDYRSHFGPWN